MAHVLLKAYERILLRDLSTILSQIIFNKMLTIYLLSNAQWISLPKHNKQHKTLAIAQTVHSKICSVKINRSGEVVFIHKTQMLKLTKVVEKFINLFSKNTCNKSIVVVI